MTHDMKSSETEELDVKDRWKNMVKKLYLVWENKYWVDDQDHFHDVTHRSQELIPFFNPKMCPEQSLFNTVVLYGGAGVGKTTVAKKCFQEWTVGGQGHAFQCAFYLQCREFNHVGCCSFLELLSRDSPELKADIEEILTKTENALFVVDGFEELRTAIDALPNKFCSDWDTQNPVPILLSNLLEGKLVPKAKVLVTTRRQALLELVLLVKQPVFAEVEGFLEQDRQEYFLRHLGDKEQALQALQAVRCNTDLLQMASAPTVCQIICTYLKLQVAKDEDLALHCQTCTSLFLKFLCSQFLLGSPGSYMDHPNERGNLLEALCILAAQSLWAEQSTFPREQLWRLGLKESDLSPFLDKFILQESGDSGHCYSFIHLCIQQLLAAMFYILKFQDEGGRDVSKWNIGSVRKLFSTEVRRKNRSQIQTGLFLFGLLNEERAQELETTFGCQTSMEVKCELLNILRDNLEEKKPSYLGIGLQEIFSYLYESQEEELVKVTLAPFKELTLCIKNNMEIVHSTFCLKYCQSLEKLSVRVVKGIFLETSDSLEACLQGVRTQNGSDPLCLWTRLCSVICSNKNLSFLEISQSFLNNPALRILCDHVTRASCCLQRVAFTDVSPVTSNRDICLALIGKKTLTHLTLTGHVEEEKTLQLMLLGEMLKHKTCNLQLLRMGSCSASIHQWNDFFSTLHMNQSLTCLDLSDNKLLDKGAKLLCMTLKHPKCFLKRVLLKNCQLTGNCCQEFSSVLTVSQRLTHLSLARNNLGDDGVKILCEGLVYPDCKLEMLILQQCNITVHGCKHLSDVLCGGSKLTHLDLGLNLVAAGLMSFCNTLKNPKCNLKCLGLWGCSLNPLYCQELAIAIASNKKLETLDLGKNTLGNKGITVILEALKDNGSLKTLRLTIDKSNLMIEGLLEKIKESRPSLKVDNVTSGTAPSYCDLFSECAGTVPLTAELSSAL